MLGFDKLRLCEVQNYRITSLGLIGVLRFRVWGLGYCWRFIGLYGLGLILGLHGLGFEATSGSELPDDRVIQVLN